MWSPLGKALDGDGFVGAFCWGALCIAEICGFLHAD